MGRAVKAGQEDLMNKVVVLSGKINELHCNLKKKKIKNKFCKVSKSCNHEITPLCKIFENIQNFVLMNAKQEKLALSFFLSQFDKNFPVSYVLLLLLFLLNFYAPKM